MWGYMIADVVCECGVYPATPGWGLCRRGHFPVAVGPSSYYIPDTQIPVERGSRVQLVLKVRGRRLAA